MRLRAQRLDLTPQQRRQVVEDCWNDNYRNAPKDASAWTSGDCRLRVLRGGNFTSPATAIRSAARFRYDVDVRYYGNGFRFVRELP